MNEIKSAVKRAALRLYVLDLFATLCVMVTVAAAAMMALRIADAFFIFNPDWGLAFAIASGGAVVAALLWSALRRRKGIEVARELDERADLRESLSTAMCVEREKDPWSAAVVESARQRAMGVDIRAAIPFVAPRLVPVPLVALIALAITWFALPAHFSFTSAAAEQEARREVQQVKVEAETFAKDIEKLVGKEKLAKLEEGSDDPAERSAEISPEQLRMREIKKLTALKNTLADEASGEKAEKLHAMERMMKQLKQPGPGPADELSRSLQNSDFEKAQKDLEDLMKKLTSGELNADQKKAMADQLSKLADQLDKLAASRKELEQRLQEAGMTAEEAKQAAADPQKLQDQLDKNENLTEQQRQQLQDAAKAQESACKACNNMGSGLQKLAQACQNPGQNPGEQGQQGQQGQSPGQISPEGMQGLQQLSDQLSELEMAQMDMQRLSEAVSQCNQQLSKLGSQSQSGASKGALTSLNQGQGQSPFKQGDTSKYGSGSGGPGKGNGMSPEEKRDAFTLEQVRADTKIQDGPVIGERFIKGEPIKGRAAQEARQVAVTSSQKAVEAIERQVVPLEFQDAVKDYFGSVEELAEKAATQGGDDE